MKTKHLDNNNSGKCGQQTSKHTPGKTWLREPLIHFFLLGLVVFGLYGVFEPKPEPIDDPFLVEVSSADIEWFRTMWTKRMGREPTVAELRGQVNQLIREQVLSREAVSMGLDVGDTVVRRRLTQKMDFFFKDLSEITEPTNAELQVYFQQNPSAYEIPGRISFTHVYFNADKRGEDKATAAVRRLVARLNATGGVPSDVSALGDSFLLQSSYADKILSDIQTEFGSRFARLIWEQKAHTWHGPVPSGYGLHAVYVHERFGAKLPPFDVVKERLKADWMSEKRRQLSRKVYEDIRGRYRVLLEGMPYNLDMSG